MPRKPAATKKPAVTKIFVLDTNVLMHDPSCLFRFEEHDVFIPIMTLEELDNHKKGMTEIARNARQASRMLDEMLAHDEVDIDEGIDLNGPSSKLASGRLYLQTEAISAELPQGLPTSKVDNQILSVVIHLQKKFPKRPVILVSKDINMRIKSRALPEGGFATPELDDMFPFLPPAELAAVRAEADSLRALPPKGLSA